MTEVLITAPCSDEIKLRLEEFKNSCVFLFKDRKSDIGSAEVVIGEPRTERIREAKNLKFVQMTWAGADIYARRLPAGDKNSECVRRVRSGHCRICYRRDSLRLQAFP